MKNITTIEELIEKVKTYITNQEDLNLINKAYAYSKEVHKDMVRLSGEPYIVHPLNAAYILTSYNADAKVEAAALLHDVLKNSETTIEDLKENFGEEITNIVYGVYKITKLNFDTTSTSSVNTQRKILVGLSEDVRVIMIKLAERLHNMRTIDVQPIEKQKSKSIENLEIFAPIAHGIGMSKLKSELEDISLKYAKPDAYNSVIDKLNQTKAERDKDVDDMIKSVSDLLNENNIKFQIKGRSKGIYSIYKKLDKGRRFEDIYDILALRVFVNTIPECYQVMGIIHSKYKPIPKRFKDFIAMPKANMYQSLHTTVYGINDEMYEIQIRTHEMDEIAERGIASHWSYKEGGEGNKSTLEQCLQFFRSIIELNSEEENDEQFLNNVKNEMFNGMVYVYTPNGDVVELPIGANPIDFAYKVHTNVGNKMVGAIVNGAIVPLDYQLHDNDVIKININKSSLGPSREWLNIAKTAGAKNKIRGFFNKIDKEENLKKGEELLQKELRKKKITFNDFFNDEENLKKVLTEFKCNALEELYINIGNGIITTGSISNFLLDKNDTKEDIILKRTGNKEIDNPHVKNDIIVEGIDEIKVNISACCRPIPGDPIVGYISKGYGINVHRKDCSNVSGLEERIIDVRWSDDVDKRYPTSIHITSLPNDNLLLEIISKTANNNITIQSINTKNSKEETVYDITLLVKNLEILEKFMNEINAIDDILNVDRRKNI